MHCDEPYDVTPEFDETGLLPLTFAQRKDFVRGIAALHIFLLVVAREGR